MTTDATPAASIVIPVKGITSGKSRLGGVLSPDERAELNRYLAVHTLEVAKDAARATGATTNVYLLSPDPAYAEICMSYSVLFLRQSSTGLNAGLTEAAKGLPDCRTVFLVSDLPELATEDIFPLLDVPGIGLAPDEAQTGTNAISVPRPDTLPFHFGPLSAHLHSQSALETGLPFEVIRRAGLAFDLDTQADLLRVKGWPHALNPRNLDA
jgi:2-phospho-L-lactate guanylyltransferase